MSPVAGARYGYQAQAWDAPLSFGLQSLIEYNGYVINDRYQADRIRVTSITGLDDADVRVSSEVMPADHGEIPYDGFYGGRTIVLSGNIEGGSLGSLKRMERDLKAAYAPLVEAPMKFRWFDVLDTFDDTATLSNYTALAGSVASLSVSSSLLNWTTTVNTILLRSADNRTWGDSQITLRVYPGDTNAGSVVSVILKVKDVNNYAFARLSGSGVLTTGVVIAGTTYVLSTLSGVPISVGQPIWLRGRIEGDLLTAEAWQTFPKTGTAAPYSTTAWMTGSDADLLGDGIVSQVGLGGQTATNQWHLDGFRVESLYPGDIVFNARKLSPISIKDSQDTRNVFRRAFQITMRSSNFRALGATQSRSLVISPAGTTQQNALGRTYSRSYPLRYSRYLSTVAQQVNNILYVRNRGTVFVKPVIVLAGPTNGLAITNITNGQQLSWIGALSAGDTMTIDCQGKTIVNSSGASLMRYFVPTSQWIQLEPSWNDLFFSVAGSTSATQAIVYFAPGWN